MNAVTKNKLSFILRIADVEKESVQKNIKHSLTISGFRMLTLNKYRPFVKEVLKERYDTYTHVLHSDVEYKRNGSNFDVIFHTIPRE